MTGVPKLQLLPAPGAQSLAPAAAASRGQGIHQEVEPVVRSPALQARGGQKGLQRHPVEERRWEGQEGPAGQRTLRPDQDPASGRRISFSGLTSMAFVVQVLGQQSQTAAAAPQSTLSQHRDAALIGSDIYRKAGGEPELLPEDATFVRIAV